MRSSLTAEQAWSKIKYYCSFRERCHYEVKEKLFGMGQPAKTVERLLSELIEEGFLNEERFCIQFAGSHFRLKKWGKQKIIYALRQKRVSDANIKRALADIPDVDYKVLLQKLALAKWNSLKQEASVARQVKTTAYLLQKGYERPMIQSVISEIRAIKKM